MTETAADPVARPDEGTVPPVGDPRRYLDRQASELEYFARVLANAADEELPLLERARFLAIFTTLSDEFFRVRVAGLMEQRAAGVRGTSRGGHTPAEQIDSIRARFRTLLDRQAGLLHDAILPGLAEAGVRVVEWRELSGEKQQHLSRLFEERIFPILTPLTVGPAHPFPFISDLSLSLGVIARSPRRNEPMFARVKVPGQLERFVQVTTEDELLLVPVEEVIGAHLDRLFPGLDPQNWHTFRVTRNADYDVEDVDVEDLLDAVASEVVERRFGHVVRLEVDTWVPAEVRALLQAELGITDADTYEVARPLDGSRLFELYDIDRPALKGPDWVPLDPLGIGDQDAAGIFRTLRGGDVIVQHPYDSFATSTQRFIEQAALDPRVLAIKQTLYRTSGDSPIMMSLMRAAENGKQAVAVVELKARFDEEANIGWARRLEEAGVHVVYGFVELKTHSKTALVIRNDEDGQIRRYGHIATGNYNPSTAKMYEDLALFTADPALTSDLGELFNYLTGHTEQDHYRRLQVAPVTLKDRLLELMHEQAHPDGRIVIKVNNLSHTELIDALYDASMAGADVDLIVRSICCLRPGIPGLSENIRVRSVVGRFLEHSRIYRFGHEPADGAYLIGSADAMPRNLERRVEAVAPVDDADLRRRLDGILDLLLRDDVRAWRLDADGVWAKIPTAEGLDVQEELKDQARTRGGR